MGDGATRVLPRGINPYFVGYFCTPSGRAVYTNDPFPTDF